MIFSLFIIHNLDRISSSTRVLHTTTWDYFTSYLPSRFIRSPEVVKEAVMTVIDDLLQEFWRTSSDGVVGTSFFAMRRLLEILQKCTPILEVCLDIISFFSDCHDLADKNLQMSKNPNSWHSAQTDDQIRAKFKILLDGCGKMFDQSLSKSKDLSDMVRFLPGVVVLLDKMSMQGMARLYRIKLDLLERLIKSTIEPLRPAHVSPESRYRLDGYLSGFLQDRDRSQLYYCDPILQHISICRHFLSFLDQSNAFDHQW
jgi:hypothetical protein